MDKVVCLLFNAQGRAFFSLVTINCGVDMLEGVFMNSNCNLITPPHLYCLAGLKSFSETLSRRNAGGNDDINVRYCFITFVVREKDGEGRHVAHCKRQK